MSALVSRVFPPAARVPLVLGVLIGIIFAAGVGAAVVAPLALVHRGSSWIETAYGHGMIGLVSRIGANGIGSNPLANDSGAVAQGRLEYTGSCAQCHGAKGDGRGMFGQTTFPPATDLTSHDVVEKSDAQLFYIIKNGLSFTPMPGYGSQYSDQDIWAMVSFLRALQKGQAGAEAVPTPTDQQLVFATIRSGTAAQRGAEVYFAQGCAACHGAVGNAPGRLALRARGEVTGAVRRGRRGMPCYGPDVISNAELQDLQAYMATFSGGNRGRGEGEGGGEGGGGVGDRGGAAFGGGDAGAVATSCVSTFGSGGG